MKTSFLKLGTLGALVPIAAAVFMACGSDSTASRLQRSALTLTLEEIEAVSPKTGQSNVCVFPAFQVRFKRVETCNYKDVSQFIRVFREDDGVDIGLTTAAPIKDSAAQTCTFFFYPKKRLSMDTNYAMGNKGGSTSSASTTINNTVARFKTAPTLSMSTCEGASSFVVEEILGGNAIGVGTNAPKLDLAELGSENENGDFTFEAPLESLGKAALGSLIQIVTGFLFGRSPTAPIIVNFSADVDQDTILAGGVGLWKLSDWSTGSLFTPVSNININVDGSKVTLKPVAPGLTSGYYIFLVTQTARNKQGMPVKYGSYAAIKID